jgi:hemerythrin-like metal-binding protein
MGWTKTLLTGIHELDLQHQIIFDIVARLDSTISTDEKWSTVHFALVELSNFVQVHFAVEEALLRLHDYPALDAHIAEHRTFSAKLAEIKQHSIRQDVSVQMADWLKNWLITHIGGSDRAYVAHLRTAPLARYPVG